MQWRSLHLLIGAAGLLLFVLQGQYMIRALGVPDLPDAARMSYRSAHIYLLLASVINVGVGYFMRPSGLENHLQRLGSVLVLVSPALLLWSFFAESTIAIVERPVAKAGLYMLFAAAVLLLLNEAYRRLTEKPVD